MSRKIATLVAASALAAIAVPAGAAPLSIAEILFGKVYNDGVSVVMVPPYPSSRDSGLPQTIRYVTRPTVQAAQAEVQANPKLREALRVRGIRISNVLDIDTALNGGKIIYAR